MPLLDPADPLKAKLELYCGTISETVRFCIDTIFSKPCGIAEDWQIVERLNGDFPHNVILGAGGEHVRVLIVFGAADAAVQALIDSTDETSISDAIGELLNNIYAVLMDGREFGEDFGVLLQSFPQCSSDVNFYPRAWGCNGTLVVPGGESVYFGLALKNSNVDDQ